jgi:hypothetical protein
METAIIKIEIQKRFTPSKTILDQYNIKDKVENHSEKGQDSLNQSKCLDKIGKQNLKKMSQEGDDVTTSLMMKL